MSWWHDLPGPAYVCKWCRRNERGNGSIVQLHPGGKVHILVDGYHEQSGPWTSCGFPVFR